LQRPTSTTHAVFDDPIVQLAALCPICALSALSPAAALAVLSPVLRLFNPAINPAAALLSFQMGGGAAGITGRVYGRLGVRMVGLATRTNQFGIFR
jgi:dolichol kinase